MNKWGKGITLAELLTSIALFMLFTLILYYCLVLGLRYSSAIEGKSDYLGPILKARDIMTSEFRQAFRYGTGSSVIDNLQGVPVFLPDPASPASSEIYFTLPNFSSLPEDSAILTIGSPENLMTMHYFVEAGNTLSKEMITYRSTGVVEAKRKLRLFTLKDRKLTLSSSYVSTGKIEAILSIAEGEKVLFTTTFHMCTEDQGFF